MLKLSTKSWFTRHTSTWDARNAPIVELDNVIFINGAGYDKITLTPLFGVQLQIPSRFEGYGVYTRKAINTTRQVNIFRVRHFNTDLLFANRSVNRNCYYFHDPTDPNRIWINASFSYHAAGVITCIDTETFEPDKHKTYVYDTSAVFEPIIYNNESVFVTASHKGGNLASQIGMTIDYRMRDIVRSYVFQQNYSRACVLYEDSNTDTLYLGTVDSYNRTYSIYKYRIGSTAVLMRRQSFGQKHMCIPVSVVDEDSNIVHIYWPYADSINESIKIKYMTLDIANEQVNVHATITLDRGSNIPVKSDDAFGYTLYHLTDNKFLLVPISDEDAMTVQMYPVALISIDVTSNSYSVLATYTTSYGSVVSMLRYNNNVFVKLDEHGFELIRVDTTNNSIEQLFADTVSDSVTGLGIDELNRLWLVTQDGSILMYSPDTQIKLDIEIAENSYTWTGNPIQTHVSVKAYDMLGNQVSVPVRLEIVTNNAKFTDNGLKVIDVTTDATQTTYVAVTITGPGSLIIKGKTL